MAFIVLSAAAVVLLAGPFLVGAIFRQEPLGERAPIHGGVERRVTIVSTLLYVLAFNLVFFIQELALVVPKAITPGLRPILFHNNHTWAGDAPIAHLLQGSGVVAILLVGATFLLLAKRTIDAQLRLFFVWMSYHGFFQALPQVAIGAFNPGNDAGMAMQYLGWSEWTRVLAALAALLATPGVALMLAPLLLSVAAEEPLSAPQERRRAMLRIATLPALLGTILVAPFRVPRELIEVILPPLLAAYIGASWLQAFAPRIAAIPAAAPSRGWSLLAPLAAVLALLAYFHLVLRPGLRFY